jgi:hypothetical protein
MIPHYLCLVSVRIDLAQEDSLRTYLNKSLPSPLNLTEQGGWNIDAVELFHFDKNCGPFGEIESFNWYVPGPGTLIFPELIPT